MLLLAGTYALLLILIVGYILGYWLELTDGSIPLIVVYLTAPSIPAVGMVFYRAFTAGGSKTPIAGSVPVDRNQAPQLWEAVERLAAQVGTPAPTQIRLTDDANAMVVERTFLLGLFASKARVLYLGAPLLVGMRVDELRAILCHELGHYARKHTQISVVAYRGSASLTVALERLNKFLFINNPTQILRLFSVPFYIMLYGPLSWYALLYYWLTSAVNRRQELEADAAASAIIGRQVTAKALRKVHAIAASWNIFTTEVLAPMCGSGRMPDDPFSAYGALLSTPYGGEEFTRLMESPPQRQQSRLDTHPSLARRLEALGDYSTKPVERDLRWAADLLADRMALFERSSYALVSLSASTLPWRQWLSLVTQTRAAAPARLLQRTVARLPGTDSTQPPLSSVLELLEIGQAHNLAAAISAELNGHANADPSFWLLPGLFSLVGQSTVHAGVANWYLSWTGTCFFAARNTTANELIEQLTPAIRRPADVPRLRLYLARLGVDESAQITLSDASETTMSVKIRPKHATGALQRNALPIRYAIAVLGAIIAITTASKLLPKMQDNTPSPTYIPIQTPNPPAIPAPSFSLPLLHPHAPIIGRK